MYDFFVNVFGLRDQKLSSMPRTRIERVTFALQVRRATTTPTRLLLDLFAHAPHHNTTTEQGTYSSNKPPLYSFRLWSIRVCLVYGRVIIANTKYNDTDRSQLKEGITLYIKL